MGCKDVNSTFSNIVAGFDYNVENLKKVKDIASNKKQEALSKFKKILDDADKISKEIKVWSNAITSAQDKALQRTICKTKKYTSPEPGEPCGYSNRIKDIYSNYDIKLVNRAGLEKCLDTDYGRADPVDSAVRLWDCHENSNNQTWELIYRGGNKYWLRNYADTKLCLGTENGSDFERLVLQTCIDEPSRHWKFESQGDAFFKIRNVLGQNCLDTNFGENPERLHQCVTDPHPNQTWNVFDREFKTRLNIVVKK